MSGAYKTGTFAAILVAALLCAPGVGVALEKMPPEASVEQPRAVVGDACAVLLNVTRMAPRRMAVVYDPHAARQVAAALALGLQFAPGPVEARYNPAKIDSGHKARAIAEYRRCKNKQTLEAMLVEKALPQ